MSVIAVCPKCSKKLKLPSADMLGKMVKCPGCDSKIRLEEAPAGAASKSHPTTKPAAKKQSKPVSKTKPAAAPTAKASSPKPPPAEPKTPVAAAPEATPKRTTPAEVEYSGIIPKPTIHSDAPLGLEPRYVFASTPSTATPAAPSSMEMPVFSPPEADSPAFDFGGSDASPGSATDSTSATPSSTGDDPIASFKAKRAARRKKMTTIGMAAAVLLAVGGGAAVWFWPPAAQPIASTPAATPTTPVSTIKTSLSIESPTRGSKVPTTLLPAGVGFVVHLRPAELWSESASAKATLAALPPSLLPWAENAIRRYASRDPREIEELTVGFVLGARGVPPQVATVVRTTEPKELGALIQEFPGELERFGEMRLIKTNDRGIFIKDEKTFAICPVDLADDLPDTATSPSTFLTTSIIDIVEQTDRDRLATFVFGVDDLGIHGPSLLPADLLSLLTSTLDTLKDPNAVAWSFHSSDNVYLEAVLMPRTGTTPVAYEQQVLKAITAAPQDMVSKLKLQNPNVPGVRELVGRFPAMLEAARLSTDVVADTRNGVVDMRTSLPLVAGPNLALASLLTYNVLANAPEVVIAANTPAVVEDTRSIQEKLQTRVAGEFQRTPLQEALAYLAEEGKINLEIDGDALKFAGYTKNMAQTFDMGEVTIQEALRRIITDNKYDKMCVAIDQANNKLVVLTYQFAEQRGLTPLKLE